MTEAGRGTSEDALVWHPAPRTRALLEAVFQEQAEQWLERPNAALGSSPLQLIAQGREREIQSYLSRLLDSAEVPPATFDSLFRSDPPG